MKKKEEKARKPFDPVRLKDRPGFGTVGMRWVYRILYPFFHCRVRISKEMREREETVVFIANHYNVFGPASFVMSMKARFRAWINEELVSAETAETNLQPGLKQMFPFLGDRMVAWLSKNLAKLAATVLTRFGVIPVDRNQPSKLITTMRQSVKALEEGENLVIFPEVGLPEYSLTSVTPFFAGFATLGRLYWRKTGKALQFCPCYIDEQHHLIRLGELVTYNPEAADITEETNRVSDELNAKIREMADENRGVEKEKTTPVRQTVLVLCNLLRTVLLIPLVTMLGIGNLKMILLFYAISEALRIVFDVAQSAYASSNRMAFLYSHGIGILTDIAVVAYLCATGSRLHPILWVLVGSGVVILFSNIWAGFHFRRCAGVNYFDTLSANLLCLINMKHLLDIPLLPMAMLVLMIAELAFMVCSAGFAVAFNARIGLEDRE